MSGSGLWNFLIVCVEILLIGAVIFIGIDFVVVAEANFKRLAKVVVGGALLLYFLFAVGAALGLSGGAAALAVSPVALIWLGVAIIVLFAVVYIANMVVDWLAPGTISAVIKLVIGIVALVVILAVAANTLSGGGIVGHSFPIHR